MARKLSSMSISTSIPESSSSLRELNSRKQLPNLSGGRRMSLKDIMIWRKFTRNLKQRVQNKQFERRTFCWWENKPSSRGTENEMLYDEIEPTYKMQPEGKPCYPQCRTVIDEYLKTKLEGLIYEDIKCANLSRLIAEEVKSLLKSLPWPQRYKCISYVNLGQKMGQALCVSSMCAWDSSNDSYITCSFQNTSLFCVVTIFAVYYE